MKPHTWSFSLFIPPNHLEKSKTIFYSFLEKELNSSNECIRICSKKNKTIFEVSSDSNSSIDNSYLDSISLIALFKVVDYLETQGISTFISYKYREYLLPLAEQIYIEKLKPNEPTSPS